MIELSDDRPRHRVDLVICKYLKKKIKKKSSENG